MANETTVIRFSAELMSCRRTCPGPAEWALLQQRTRPDNLSALALQLDVFVLGQGFQGKGKGHRGDPGRMLLPGVQELGNEFPARLLGDIGQDSGPMRGWVIRPDFFNRNSSFLQ